MGILTPKAIRNRFPENHGIAGDLLDTSIENLVILAQEISAMGAAGHNRHHLAIGVFGCSLNGQLIDGKASFPCRTIRPDGTCRSSDGPNRAYKGIAPAAARDFRRGPGRYNQFSF